MHSPEEREKALALLAIKPPMRVAEETGIPYTTLRDWLAERCKEDPTFVDYRNKKKQEFVDNAWEIIETGNKLLKTKLERALTAEEQINDILAKARESSELDKEDVANLVKYLGKLNVDNMGQVTTVIGTLYDKQALINKESTVNHGVDSNFEKLLKSLQGEEM